MSRMHRRLLIVPLVVLAACGGRRDAEKAEPPAGAPADATPWQVRDSAGDTAFVRR